MAYHRTNRLPRFSWLNPVPQQSQAGLSRKRCDKVSGLKMAKVSRKTPWMQWSQQIWGNPQGAVSLARRPSSGSQGEKKEQVIRHVLKRTQWHTVLWLLRLFWRGWLIAVTERSMNGFIYHYKCRKSCCWRIQSRAFLINNYEDRLSALIMAQWWELEIRVFKMEHHLPFNYGNHKERNCWNLALC